MPWSLECHSRPIDSPPSRLITEPVAKAAGESLSTATRWAAFAAAGFLVLGFLASLSLGASKPLGDPDPPGMDAEPGLA